MDSSSGCRPSNERVDAEGMFFRHAGSPGEVIEAVAPNGLIVERPPPGLARGKYPTSPGVVLALGITLVLGSLVYCFLRLRNRGS